MGKAVLFGHVLTFDEKNLKKKVDYLYELMECPRDISAIESRINDRNPAEYEENEKLKPFAKELQSKPLWERLLKVRGFFDQVGYKNMIPYHFERTIAPFFFKNFPRGEIWFVERDQEDLRLMFRKESALSKKIYGTEGLLHGKFPQSMSGLQIYDILQDFGLSLSLIVNFPKIHGSNAYTGWGSFVFILDSPIDVRKDYGINITDALSVNIDLLYADDLTITRGIRPQIEYLERKVLPKYLEWYVSHLGLLIDFIFNMKDLEKFCLLSLTLSRICVETYLIQVSWSSFIRKIVFFNLLDKYASLVKEFSNLRVKDGTIWMKLLAMTTYDEKIKKLLENIDNSVGSRFEEVGSALYEENITTVSLGREKDLDEQEVSKLLRAYRNSHHGYFLWPDERKLILSHSGNISNALPDLSVILWHVFLQNPQEFFDSFSQS